MLDGAENISPITNKNKVYLKELLYRGSLFPERKDGLYRPKEGNFPTKG